MVNWNGQSSDFLVGLLVDVFFIPVDLGLCWWGTFLSHEICTILMWRVEFLTRPRLATTLKPLFIHDLLMKFRSCLRQSGLSELKQWGNQICSLASTILLRDIFPRNWQMLVGCGLLDNVGDISRIISVEVHLQLEWKIVWKHCSGVSIVDSIVVAETRGCALFCSQSACIYTKCYSVKYNTCKYCQITRAIIELK